MDAVKLLDQLSPADIDSLREAATELSFLAGDIIFEEGDPGRGAYAVKSGTVEISTLLATGERSLFSTVPAGDIFGEMAVIDEKPRSARATAGEDCQLYFIPTATMLGFLRRSPGMTLVLLKEISGRLREFNHHYMERIVQSERLAVIGRLASSIIHDLKTPLTVISLTTELASAEHAPLDMRQQAKKQVLKQVDHINQMVGDVLEFSRGNQQEHPRCLVNYAAFVAEVIEEVEKEVERRNVALVLENDPPSLELLMHSQRLSRVFWNLVRNAADVLSAGGRVILRFSVSQSFVTTEVEDTGTGIAPEILDRLFEAFATYGKPQGTGLGLSITRKIIQEHGGQITARNRPGGGAIFSFILPLPGHESA
jgi:signal transduction histidine kinase